MCTCMWSTQTHTQQTCDKMSQQILIQPHVIGPLLKPRFDASPDSIPDPAVRNQSFAGATF